MRTVNLKTKRVVRGGSWHFRARFCRAGSRISNAPDFRGVNLGFRLSTRFVRGKKK